MLEVGIVGLGWWGKELVRSVRGDSEQIKFILAADLNPEKLQKFATDYNLELCGSMEDMLDLPDIEGVVLATPHSQHVEQIIACAEVGKHVFSEKPLALTLTEARRAIDAIQEHKVIFGLGTDRRFLPAIIDLKTMIEENKFGEILQVEVQYSNDNMSKGLTGDWRSLDSEAPGAGMTGPGLHALDALINLAGPVKEISGNLRRPFGHDEPIDAITLMLEFDCGVTGLLGCVRGCPRYSRLAVYGAEGWAEIKEFSELHYHISGKQKSVRFYEPGRATKQALEHFARAVNLNTSFPVSTTSMLHTVAAFETAIKSFEIKGPIKVPTV